MCNVPNEILRICQELAQFSNLYLKSTNSFAFFLVRQSTLNPPGQDHLSLPINEKLNEGFFYLYSRKILCFKEKLLENNDLALKLIETSL